MGRARELAEIETALETHAPVCLLGAIGLGKTQLGKALVHKAQAAGRRAAYVPHVDGDDVDTVLARAERLIGALPDTLAEFLETTATLVVFDDVHALGAEVKRLVRLPGHIVLLSEDKLPVQGLRSIALDGLAVDDARALWMRLEECHGPTPQGAVDTALGVTQGRPLALRREYARARFEADEPWDLGSISDEERRLLAAAAVLGSAPAAAIAVVAGRPIDALLRSLVERQLLSAVDGGRFGVHEAVGKDVLLRLSATERRRLEADAGSLVIGRAQAWQRAGGDAAPSDPCERALQAAAHYISAGLREEATAVLIENETVLLDRGAGGELRSLLGRLARLGRDAALTALMLRVLVAGGRVAAARELWDSAGSPTPALRLAGAELALLGGEPAVALARLEPLLHEDDAAVRAEANGLAALIELERGRMQTARARALEGSTHPSGARALGIIEARDGGHILPIERLVLHGRRAEAEAELAEAQRVALASERRGLAGDLERRRAVVAASGGRLVEAERILVALAPRARALGQELLALRSEADLAAVLLARGRAQTAAQIAAEVVGEANRRGLATIAAEAELVVVGADVETLRLPDAARAAAALMVAEAAPAWVRVAARRLATRAAVWLGDPLAVNADPTNLEDMMVAAEVAQVRGEPDRALAILVRAALAAERSGRHAELATALADAARLHHARGDRHAAACAAARALTEASSGGADRTVARALLVTAALAREDGDLVKSRNAATDALTIARAAELGLERYAAAAAAETLARLAQDGPSADTLATVARAATATLSETAITAGERFVADLGLSPTCAFRLISADGAVSYAAKMDASRLGLERKELVIDGDAELVLRHGKRVADLRRRTLLKRLLFLFASAPGRLFTKEEIVERIWGVEYHPLHHDAALFTNVMRLRRLLGPGGQDILRVGEGGYLLVPPHDFLFIERLPV